MTTPLLLLDVARGWRRLSVTNSVGERRCGVSALLREHVAVLRQRERLGRVTEPPGHDVRSDAGGETAQEHQLDSHELLTRATQAHLALAELESEAIELVEAYGEECSSSQELELLSLFETARMVPTIDWLHNTHLARAGALWHQLTPRGKAEERVRLELIGGIVGRAGLSEHFPLDEQEQAAPVQEEPSPLEQLRGLVVLLVGGNANTFRHVRDQLLTHEPEAVDHIEASWDRNRTARSLKPRLQNADVVIEATSQMKHQDSEVLQAALGSPPSARRIRAAGGPSVILHHVANALSRS